MPVCNFILFYIVCIVFRKVHVHRDMHSLFTLETVDFPECLQILDSDITIKSIMQFVELHDPKKVN